MADDLNDVTDDETNESSEAQIAVHWREENYYEPPAALTAQANARSAVAISSSPRS